MKRYCAKVMGTLHPHAGHLVLRLIKVNHGEVLAAWNATVFIGRNDSSSPSILFNGDSEHQQTKRLQGKRSKNMKKKIEDMTTHEQANMVAVKHLVAMGYAEENAQGIMENYDWDTDAFACGNDEQVTHASEAIEVAHDVMTHSISTGNCLGDDWEDYFIEISEAKLKEAVA